MLLITLSKALKNECENLVKQKYLKKFLNRDSGNAVEKNYPYEIEAGKTA